MTRAGDGNLRFSLSWPNMVRICCFVVVYFFSVGHYNLSQVCLVFYVEMVFKMESFYFIAIRKNSGSFLVPVRPD